MTLSIIQDLGVNSVSDFDYDPDWPWIIQNKIMERHVEIFINVIRTQTVSLHLAGNMSVQIY